MRLASTDIRGPNSRTEYNYAYRVEDIRVELEKSLNEAILISTDIESNYIPLFALFEAKHLKVGDELSYSIYWITPRYSRGEIRLQSLILTFNYSIRPVSYTKESIRYYIQKNLIYTIFEDKVVILFCTVLEKSYIDQLPKNFDDSNIDKNRFLMVVNTDFMIPRYKSFYTYFTKVIMNPVLSKGYDFVFTTDITKYCFKPIVVTTQFATIVDMKNYLTCINDEATSGLLNG